MCSLAPHGDNLVILTYDEAGSQQQEVSDYSVCVLQAFKCLYFVLLGI